jgi:hypothetical protein
MECLLSNRWFRIAAGFMAMLLTVAFSACWQTRIWSLDLSHPTFPKGMSATP